MIDKIPIIVLVTILSTGLYVVTNTKSAWYKIDTVKIPLQRKTLIPFHESITIGVE
jgi:hypothetical protein